MVDAECIACLYAAFAAVIQGGAMSAIIRAIAALFPAVVVACTGDPEQPGAASPVSLVLSAAHTETEATPSSYGMLSSQIRPGAGDGQVYEYH
jgi:hypothetical protein